jgi:hypothetical protein
MPLDPKKPLNELLEASAKARRAAFGGRPENAESDADAAPSFEISRLARKDECESRWRAFGISWPRLVTATLWLYFSLARQPSWCGGNTSPAAGETMEAGTATAHVRRQTKPPATKKYSNKVPQLRRSYWCRPCAK